MRSLAILMLLVCGCSRPKKTEAPLAMHLLQVSYYSDNPSWGVIRNAGSLVVSITSGKASGELFHVAKGKAESLEVFEFDAAMHTFLSSTPTIESGAPAGEVDLSFIQDADQGFNGGKGKELKLKNVFSVSRAGEKQTIKEGANVLFRIQRTDAEQDRWRFPQEASLQAMIDTSKQLDCEYIVLVVKKQGGEEKGKQGQ